MLTETTTALDDKLKQYAARQFCADLIKNQHLLKNYLDVLAKSADTPDEKIANINDFIQHKSKNGVDDYQTDFDYVLQAEQTMPAYQFIYWSGFYDTTISKQLASEITAGAKYDTAAGENFVIAATLNIDDPIHIGLGRSQIISPTFQNLVLTWDKSEVQPSSAKLVFNLVSDNKGNVRRTFAGVYDDGNGARLFSGIAKIELDQTPDERDKDKFSLPPALQVIFPVIAAIGSIVGAIAGTIAIAWAVRQWKDRNARLAGERRDNPNDQPRIDRLQLEDNAAGQRVGEAEVPVGRQAEAIDIIPPRIHREAVNPIAGPSRELTMVEIDSSAAMGSAARVVADSPEMDIALEQLRSEPVLVPEGPGESSGGSGITIEEEPFIPGGEILSPIEARD